MVATTGDLLDTGANIQSDWDCYGDGVPAACFASPAAAP